MEWIIFVLFLALGWAGDFFNDPNEKCRSPWYYFQNSSNVFPIELENSGNMGMSIFWNQNSVITGKYGVSELVNFAQGGSGGFSFYSINSGHVLHLLMQIYENGYIIVIGLIIHQQQQLNILKI